MASKLTKGANLRWESSRMMLPEHVEQFNQYNRSKTKIIKPIVDEQKLEEINNILQIAIEDYTPVCIEVFKHGEVQEFRCYVNKFDNITKKLHITNEEGKIKVDLEEIVDINLT